MPETNTLPLGTETAASERNAVTVQIHPVGDRVTVEMNPDGTYGLAVPINTDEIQAEEAPRPHVSSVLSRIAQNTEQYLEIFDGAPQNPESQQTFSPQFGPNAFPFRVGRGPDGPIHYDIGLTNTQQSL